MPEWLRENFQHDGDIPLPLLVIRLGIALVLGCVVAEVYRQSRGQTSRQTAGLAATLVLLTLLIAMVTLVIGNSVARAFSLVGALAIVRFRTVVEDTRDTAFVIFAVAVGMAVGAGYLLVPLVGIPFATAAAYLFRPARESAAVEDRDFKLSVRVGLGNEPEKLFAEVFAKHLEGTTLLSAGTARQGMALDLVYAVRLRAANAALRLVADITLLDGVQGVDIQPRG
jgi:hypothetical protein